MILIIILHVVSYPLFHYITLMATRKIQLSRSHPLSRDQPGKEYLLTCKAILFSIANQ